MWACKPSGQAQRGRASASHLGLTGSGGWILALAAPSVSICATATPVIPATEILNQEVLPPSGEETFFDLSLRGKATSGGAGRACYTHLLLGTSVSYLGPRAQPTRLPVPWVEQLQAGTLRWVATSPALSESEVKSSVS